jgi:DNA-binding MarR family transcriptional regulator
VREVDPDDRRVKRLRLTPAGVKLHRRLMAEVDRLGARALEGVSTADQEHLRATLDRIRMNLSDE